jgi:hypothetical protein
VSTSSGVAELPQRPITSADEQVGLNAAIAAAVPRRGLDACPVRGACHHDRLDGTGDLGALAPGRPVPIPVPAVPEQRRAAGAVLGDPGRPAGAGHGRRPPGGADLHISSVRRPATGRSRGLVVTQECGCSERMPQSGQHLACSSTVTRASIGFPSSPVTTEVTATPSRPSRRVASLVKPVTFSRSLLSQRLGRGPVRSASADGRGTWPRTCPVRPGVVRRVPATARSAGSRVRP